MSSRVALSAGWESLMWVANMFGISPRAIWIWTKLSFTKGTFVIARKSPVAVFGCGEA